MLSFFPIRLYIDYTNKDFSDIYPLFPFYLLLRSWYIQIQNNFLRD